MNTNPEQIAQNEALKMLNNALKLSNTGQEIVHYEVFLNESDLIVLIEVAKMRGWGLIKC